MTVDVFLDGSAPAAGAVLLPETAGRVTVFAPAGWPDTATPSGAPPVVVTGGTAIEALIQACAAAARERRALLVLLAGVEVSADAAGVLADATAADPLFGLAIPRVADDDGWVRPLPDAAAGAPPLPRRALADTPPTYLAPEQASPVTLIRADVVSNLAPPDREFDSAVGALVDLACRARRVGFRTVIANRAVVVAGRETTGPAVPAGDLDRLAARYPERARVAAEYGTARHALGEAVLAARPTGAGSDAVSVLLDLTNVPPYFNGTAQAAVAVAAAIHAEAPPWTVEVRAGTEAAAFHRMTARLPGWTVRAATDGPRHTIAIRLSQPWHVSELAALHGAAFLNACLMLDSIAWDIGYTAPPGLGRVWRLAARHADALLFPSDFSRARFETRFGVFPDVRRETVRFSCDPAEYRALDPAPDPDEYLLVVGNPYDHKHVDAAVALLARAFPFQPIKALGASAPPEGGLVECLPSGPTPEPRLHALFARARIVVFPSFYEGFGFPMFQALAYGRPLVLRRSALVEELAAVTPPGGTVVEFDGPESLFEHVARLLHGEPVPARPLGAALHDGRAWSWRDTARALVAVVDDLVSAPDVDRWRRRHDALNDVLDIGPTRG